MKRLRAAVFGMLSVALASGCAGILGIASEVERAEPAGEGGGHDGAMTEEDAPDAPDGDATADASETREAEAGPPLCDVAKDFDPPQPIDSVNTAEDDGAARMSEDELTMYVDGPRIAKGPSYNIWFTTRASLTAPFGPLQAFPSTDNSIDTADDEYAPNVTTDGTTLVFERKTLATSDSNLYIATRSNPGSPFGTVSPIANLNTPDYEANVYLRGDAKELWHVRKPIQGGIDVDISLATLQGGTGYVIEPANGQLAAVNMLNIYDASPVISKNGLALYFSSDRPAPGGLGGTNIWVATRSVKGGSFNAPVIVANVNSAGNDYPGFISGDGCRLYLVSTRSGGKGGQDIYMATRPR